MNCPSCKKDVGPFRPFSKFKACPQCGQVVWLDGHDVKLAPHSALKVIPLSVLNDLEREQLAVRHK